MTKLDKAKNERLVRFFGVEYCRVGGVGYVSVFGFEVFAWIPNSRCLFGFCWSKSND